MAFGNPDFDVFQLPEEHEALREAIRALSERRSLPTPRTSTKARFPEEARAALVANGSTPSMSPSSSTARGADSLAACIVIEEVARVDVSASLIPAVNKLGNDGLDPLR